MSARQDRRTASALHGNYSGFRGPGVYPVDLEPFARPGDYVRLVPADEVRRVEAIVPIPTIFAFDSDESNTVTASANTTTADQDATELEMQKDYLGQLRMVNPEADIPSTISEVQLDQGGGQSPMWTTKNSRGFIDRDTSLVLGMSAVTELYVWEDTTPKFTFINDGAQQTVQDIRFSGFSFEMSQPTNAPESAHVEPVVIESLRTSRGG